MAAAPTVSPLYLPFIPMATTQKIRVVLEVDLTYDEQARASHLPGTAVNETDTAYARALLAALQTDPVRYVDFIKTIVMNGIQVFEEGRALVGLSGISYPYEAGLEILEQVIPQLSPEAQAHFHLANQESWFSDSVDTIYNALSATPTKMSVEYPVIQ
jgi:hypothetical protein